MIEYKGFEIYVVRPHKKITARIVKNGQYKQTCNNVIDAKRLIDFCLKYKVKGWS